MRAVVFGVDGLTFRILHPMMERGDLPNFRKLRADGCEAVLESKYPPLTPPAWNSLSTGLKPARHGVYDFWTYDEQSAGGVRKAHVQTRRKGGKAIWNILSEYGKQVLVINVPATYPPETVNGIMVSGYMTPSSAADFTYPASFKEELYRVVPDYEIDLDLREVMSGNPADRPGRRVDATLRMTERRIKLIMHLLKEKPWDFCYLAFVGPDRLQHTIWAEISALEPRAVEYFHLLDSALGLIMEQLGPDDCLFVVSDHGFQGVSRSFDINEYLYGKGLLKLNAQAEAQRSKASQSAHLKQMLRQVGLLDFARKTLRRTRRTLKQAGLMEQAFVDYNQPLSAGIDWEQSEGYVPSLSGYGGGFADVFLSPDMEAERVAELCEDLKRQVDPVTGKSLIDAIYTTEVYGTGPYAPKEQHLILLPNDGITFWMNLGNKWLWNDIMRGRDSGKGCGTHQKDGVLYAYGAGIKQGFAAPNAEVYDLVPTVLCSMKLPLPYDFDGRILDELFVERQVSATENGAAEGGLARRKLKKLLEV